MLLLIFLSFGATPAQGAGVGCEGEWAQSPICLERAAALQARAQTEALLENLPDAAALANADEVPLDTQEIETAKTDYASGMALYRDEYFGDAAVKFNAAAERLLTLEQIWREDLALRLAEAEASLAAGDFEAAENQYAAVLDWAPDSEAAATGLSDARQAIAARNSLELVRQHLAQGDLEKAETGLNTIAPGLLSAPVNELRQAIAQARRQARLNQAMSRGFQQLDRGVWAEAEAAFNEALRINPAASAAKDALRSLHRQRTDAELAAARAELAQRLADEHWPAAQQLLETIGQLDPGDAAIAGQLAQITHLAEVERQIDNYLASPQRLAAKAIRGPVKALLDTITDPLVYGLRIVAKRDRLQQAFTVWTTPVELSIHSDNRTEVRIRPGRVLGKFREHRLAVLPGNYVLSGRRAGYREVSLPITLAPGADAQTLEIACNERF